MSASLPEFLIISIYYTKRMNFYILSAAHDIGTVTLQVVIDGRPMSSKAIFEYRQHEFSPTITSLTMPHSPSLLKFHLLQKLDSLEDYLQPSNSHQTDNHQSVCFIFVLSGLKTLFLCSFYLFFSIRKKVYSCSVNRTSKIDWSNIVKK